jgi:predicted dehydrogenase
MYVQALAKDYRQHAQLVGLCDSNAARLDLARRSLPDDHPDVSLFDAADFETMVKQTRPDCLIVTSKDVTHSDYIIRGLELGLEVITEKPMTTDEHRCGRILEALRRTGGRLRVTFNYRYSPPRSQIRRLLQERSIGRIGSVDFNWWLDTSHGADYFRRWHRNRANSGSLLVHKATHHFDLVNWWLASRPVEVFAMGRRAFYTPHTADDVLGLSGRSDRCHTCGVRDKCPFFLDLAANAALKALYLDCEHADGYFRDRCVFSEQIDIWDTMTLSVRYESGVLMSYSLNAYLPIEGYAVAFNGAGGRLEHRACESTYISGDGSVPGQLQHENVSTTLIPSFETPRAVEVEHRTGGHGGGDELLLDDIFLPQQPPDPLGRRAGHLDGAYSILVGIAAYRSIDAGRPVRIDELVKPELLQ